MKSIFLTVCFLTAFIYPAYSGLYNISPNIGVHFNDPEGLTNRNSPPMDIIFAEYLSWAVDTEIYAAFYDITSTTVSYALNSAQARGCTVYFICDADPVSDQTTAYNLIKTPYKIRTAYKHGSKEIQVHNKFCVLKDSSVWTGSWNATLNDTYKNNNNVVVLRSNAVAGAFEQEFKNMYNPQNNRQLFGFAKSTSTTPSWNAGIFFVDGVKVTVLFSPYSNPASKRTNSYISDVLDRAQKSIYVSMFTFGRDTGLDDKIIQKHQEGISAAVVLDGAQNADSLAFSNLNANGVSAVLDANKESLHSKYAIIDYGYKSATVITGSHNWTNDANEENDENLLIIETSTVAGLYYQDHKKIFNFAQKGYQSDKKSVISNITIYPQPSKSFSKIAFDLGNGINSVKIGIVTLTGNTVREILCPNFNSGFVNEYSWDLKNDSGEDVADGIYFIAITAVTPDGKITKLGKIAIER